MKPSERHSSCHHPGRSPRLLSGKGRR
jgi:hypothetical protein